MTDQEVFDIVAKHLLTQNKRAVNSKGFCVYRANDGSKCAFGVLITDEEYSSEMEHKGSSILIGHKDYPSLDRFAYNIGIIASLQHIHDTINPKSWKDNLKDLAYMYGLNTDILNGFE